jgi:outer membrane protein assembly factor BamB
MRGFAGAVALSVALVGTQVGTPLSRAQVATTSWPQVGLDPTHTAFNQAESILDTSNVGGLTLKWQSELGGSGTSSPVVDGGRVFETSYTNGSLSAFDVADGTLQWRFRLGRDMNVNTPAISGGRVFLSSDSPTLYALDEASGAVLWQLQMENLSAAAPAVVTDGPETTVYVGGGGKVYAVDGDDGSVLWTQSPFEPYAIQATPAVANGVVYVADDAPVVHAYDAATGSELWQTPLGENITAPSYVVIDGGLLLVAQGGGKLFAVDAATGAVQWKRQVYADSQPSTANGIVYIHWRKATQIRLTAVDESTGSLLWQVPLGAPYVYSFTGGTSIANGVLYTTSLAGAVLGFDASSGTTLWTYSTPVGPGNMPAVVDGMVFASAGGRMLAFGL